MVIYSDIRFGVPDKQRSVSGGIAIAPPLHRAPIRVGIPENSVF